MTEDEEWWDTFIRRLCLVLGTIWVAGGVLLALTSLWWWAVAGMTHEVGFASGITALVLVVFGVILLDTAMDSVDEDED